MHIIKGIAQSICTCRYRWITGPAEDFSKWGGRAPKTREILGEYGGMLPEKIFESRVSEMPFPGFWVEILENSQDCKKLRTAPNSSFNISLTLITGIRSFLILSQNDAILSRAHPLKKLKDPDYKIYVMIRVQISARRL